MDIESALRNIGDWISKETELRKYPKGELLELSESLQVLKSAITRQSETEMAVCPNCGGSGIYQEYDEYDRYEVYVCYKCDGSGEVDRQQESEDRVMLKCCMCGDVFDVGFEMPNGDYVCATHECCYEYCKNEGKRIYQEEN